MIAATPRFVVVYAYVGSICCQYLFVCVQRTSRSRNGKLRCDYNVLQAVPRKRKSVRDSVVDPLRAAIGNLLQWLNSLMKKCYIAAHNLNFDGPRLFDAISFCSLNDDFSNVIEGFIDTLQVIRKEIERKSKTKCTLTELANWLSISCVNAHNAIQDVSMLEEMIKKSNISYETLIKYAVNYADK